MSPHIPGKNNKANLPVEPLSCAIHDKDVGVYYGWGTLNRKSPAYKVVLSIGWNPYYHNVKKTVEVHFIHDFGRDFYGEHVRVVVTGYIRPQLDFDSLGDLKDAIRSDVDIAKESLESEEHITFRLDEHLFGGIDKN